MESELHISYREERGFRFVGARGVPEILILPSRKTRFSAGYDFMCPYTTKIPAGGEAVIYTRVKAFMLPDEYLELHMRSSMAIKHGLKLKNGTGIIDSDYYDNPENEGEIIAVIQNTGAEDFIIEAGVNFIQGIFCKYLIASGDIAIAERRGGIGSTDK